MDNKEVIEGKSLVETIAACNDLKILKRLIVELRHQKRILLPNKNSIKWMQPFHRNFEDNSGLIKIEKNSIQRLIDLAQLRISEINTTK